MFYLIAPFSIILAIFAFYISPIANPFFKILQNFLQHWAFEWFYAGAGLNPLL